MSEKVITHLVPSERVVLPVGVEKNGVRYRNVVIDEMTGLDEHLVSAKRVGANGAKGLTSVLTRCVQEIEGLIPRKKSANDLLDAALFRSMTQVDRDYLTAAIYVLGGKEDLIMAGECPRCEKPWEDTFLISELEVTMWPEDAPCEIPFELLVGVPEEVGGEIVRHKSGFLRFPTGKDIEMIAELDSTPAIMDALLAACITRVGTLERINQETAKALRSRDRIALSQAIQYELPGLRQWMSIKCSCGREFDIRADLSSFFGSRRKKEKSGNNA